MREQWFIAVITGTNLFCRRNSAMNVTIYYLQPIKMSLAHHSVVQEELNTLVRAVIGSE